MLIAIWLLSIRLIASLMYSTAQADAVSYTIVPVNDSVESINITACYGLTGFKQRIVTIPMSWYDATETCNMMNYAEIDYAQPTWSRRWQVRDYLQTSNFSDSNYTFWFGRVRPYIHVKSWYRILNGKCKLGSKSPLTASGDFTDGQCSVIRHDVQTCVESLAVADCHQSHPFVCYQNTGSHTLYVYDGFDFSSEPSNIELVSVENITKEQCHNICSDQKYCFSYTFYNVTKTCIYANSTNAYYSHVDYTLSRMSNATHYAKLDCHFDIISILNSTSEVSNVSQTIPNCDVDEIPPGYRPCGEHEITQQCGNDVQQEADEITEAELQETVGELIKNLTVSKASTTINKRKTLSASDDRKSAKAFGVLGVLFIAFTFVLFPLNDFLVPLMMTKNAVAKNPDCVIKDDQSIDSCENLDLFELNLCD